jgi:hypothetical protein
MTPTNRIKSNRKITRQGVELATVDGFDPVPPRIKSLRLVNKQNFSDALRLMTMVGTVLSDRAPEEVEKALTLAAGLYAGRRSSRQDLERIFEAARAAGDATAGARASIEKLPEMLKAFKPARRRAGR